MISHTEVNKTIHKTSGTVSSRPSGGETIAAIAPPSYGIDFVDHGLVATIPIQREEKLEGEETPVQAKSNSSATVQKSAVKPNHTGLPVNLKSGIEHLSGFAMDDVRVHYNSSKPAQLNAHAYAQGKQIHLGSGQEKHLPHEAWHVVQQKQGRVKPTMQAKGIEINDDSELEVEADVMGERALRDGRSSTVDRMHAPLLDMNNEQNTERNSGKISKLSKARHAAWDGKSVMGLGTQKGSVLQRKMTANPKELQWKNAIKPAIQDFTIDPNPNVTIANIKATTKPEFIKEMDDPEISQTILDPSTKRRQRLTKMHMIRGRFGGPGDKSNLRLGTAKSNNFHPQSHYSQVEKPIGDYLKAGKGKRAVNYIVQEGDTSPPQYLIDRLKGKKSKTINFVKEMCPSSFLCSATFYLTNGVIWKESNTQVQNVRLDVKAPGWEEDMDEGADSDEDMEEAKE